MDHYITKAGTSLPLMLIKGKPYLQVAYRIVWFREENKSWSIRTKIVSHDKEVSIVCAEIFDHNQSVLASAHKREDVKGFFDHLEKAETGAIGRALALLGYGTQFCLPDLDEGERLADSPVNVPSPSQTSFPKGKPLPVPIDDLTEDFPIYTAQELMGEKTPTPIQFPDHLEKITVAAEKIFEVKRTPVEQMRRDDTVKLAKKNGWKTTHVAEYLECAFDRKLGELTQAEYEHLHEIIKHQTFDQAIDDIIEKESKHGTNTQIK